MVRGFIVLAVLALGETLHVLLIRELARFQGRF